MAVPLTKDYDEQLKAAASGDHHLSPEAGATDDGGTDNPEPPPDVVKLLSGLGHQPHRRHDGTWDAWTQAATDALTRGGTPLDVVDHVMAEVRPNARGEPIRSADAVRLDRLRKWTGTPSPLTADELYSELQAGYPTEPPVALLRPALPPWCGECGVDTGNDPEFVRKNPRFRYLAGRKCPACHPDRVGEGC